MKRRDKATGYVPRALREVWEWKAEIAKEVEGMPLREGLQEILRRAHDTALEMGFDVASSRKHVPSVVRETKSDYGSEPTRKAHRMSRRASPDRRRPVYG
jgi:hypothetical protein